MLGMIERGEMSPLVNAVPLERWEQAMDDLMGRKVVGKVVFQVAKL
jgi:hypothetical protein